MMRLYIMRHGHALAAGENGIKTDAQRPLSEQGKGEVRISMRHLLQRGARPALILASPLKRAQQTAREAAEALNPAPRVETFEPLSNQTTGERLFDRIREAKLAESEILLVGHQPQLGEMASYLAGQAFILKTAGIVALEIGAPGKARLLWSANPEDIPS